MDLSSDCGLQMTHTKTLTKCWCDVEKEHPDLGNCALALFTCINIRVKVNNSVSETFGITYVISALSSCLLPVGPMSMCRTHVIMVRNPNPDMNKLTGQNLIVNES